MSTSSRKFKVLFCSPRGKLGGICQWTENIIEYANSNSYNTDVDIQWYFTVSKDGKLISEMSKITRIFVGIKKYIPFIIGLKKIIDDGKYDVVHFSTSGGLSFIRDYFALKACKKKGLKTCLHLHFGRMPQVLSGNNFESKMFRKLIPYVSTFIVMDKQTFSSFQNSGFKNVEYLPNPLSHKVMNTIYKYDDCVRFNNLILYAGHVIPSKGVYELVQACKGLKDIKLELVGPCSDDVKKNIISIAGDGNNEWLEIKGKQSHDYTIKRMKECAIFVLPSYSEGFPNVIIESMACGCSIISTPVGAIPEMLQFDTLNPLGTKVPVRDSQAIAEAITQVLDNMPYYKEIGVNAREIVLQNYTIDKIFAKMESIWLN